VGPADLSLFLALYGGVLGGALIVAAVCFPTIFSTFSFHFKNVWFNHII